MGCAAGTGCSFYSGGQIVASASPNVTISGNTVSGAMGIGILQQYRTDSCDCPPYNPSCCSTGLCSGATPYHNVHDLSIHDNDITETAAGSGQGAVAGLVTDICNGTCAAGTAQAGSACDATYYFDAAAGAMIDYGHDTYHIPACTLSDWAWSNGSIAWTAWNGDGEDTTGTCGP